MIMKWKGMVPDTKNALYVAENATLIGDVTLEKDSSVLFGAVLRGDVGSIILGEGSNLQDLVVVHSSGGMTVRIGKNVTVGHSAIIHGCTLEDNILIGMGAIIMDRAHIGHDCLIGAGTLVKEGTVIPPYSLVVGSPARIVRTLSEEQIAKVRAIGGRYRERAALYREEAGEEI